MAQYELEGLFSASLDGLKGMADTNSVVGKPIQTPDGTTIIPVTKISVGYGMGGWNYGDEKEKSEFKKDGITAGSGGGVTVSPIGFLVVPPGGDVKFIGLDNTSSFDKICEMIPDALNAISGIVKKD